MTIDLKKDAAKIKKYVRQRVREYPIYENCGPGHDDDPISMITLGFEIDQSQWIALIFDTRPDAMSDGDWTMHLEDFVIMEMKGWRTGNSIKLIDGETVEFENGFDEEEAAGWFGEMLSNAFADCIKQGVFTKLPTAETYLLNVEHQAGAFGRSFSIDGTVEDEEETESIYDAIEREIISKSKGKSKKNATAYWLNLLRRVMEKKTQHPDSLHRRTVVMTAIASLFDLGASTQVQLVNLCTEFGTIAEYDKEASDYEPNFHVNLEVMNKIYNTYTTNEEKKVPKPPATLEKALKRLIATCAPFNCRIPGDAAFELWKVFGYKRPKQAKNGKLINLDDYA